MNTIISSALPFANIFWYRQAIQAGNIQFDHGERFEKMSFRNRYYIGTANGILLLSIPLASGRDQKILMKDLRIAYQDKWQHNHWRSIESAYKKTPFFEFYADYIQPLYTDKIDFLVDWNYKSFEVIQQLLKLPITCSLSNTYIQRDAEIGDLRDMRPNVQLETQAFAPYLQPFDIKHGFLPNLSILDLIFCEGPASLTYLR